MGMHNTMTHFVEPSEMVVGARRVVELFRTAGKLVWTFLPKSQATSAI